MAPDIDVARATRAAPVPLAANDAATASPISATADAGGRAAAAADPPGARPPGAREHACGHSPPRAIAARALASPVPSAPDDGSSYGSASSRSRLADGSREGDGSPRAVALAGGAACASAPSAAAGRDALPPRDALASAPLLVRTAEGAAAGAGGASARGAGPWAKGGRAADAVEDEDEDKGEGEDEDAESDGAGLADNMSAVETDREDEDALPDEIGARAAVRPSGQAPAAAPRAASPPSAPPSVPSAPSSLHGSSVPSSFSRSSPSSSVTSPTRAGEAGGAAARAPAPSARPFRSALDHSHSTPAFRRASTDSSDLTDHVGGVFSHPLPTALPFPDDGGLSDGSSDDSLLEAPMGSWSEVTRPSQDTLPIGRAAGREPRGRALERADSRAARDPLADAARDGAAASEACVDREAYGIHESGSACAVGSRKQPFFAAPPPSGSRSGSRDGSRSPLESGNATSAALSSREHSGEGRPRGGSRSRSVGGRESAAPGAAAAALADAASSRPGSEGARRGSTDESADAPFGRDERPGRAGARAHSSPEGRLAPSPVRSTASTPRGAPAGPREPYPASSPSPPPPGGVSPARSSAGAAGPGSSRRPRRLRPEDDRVWQTVRREAAADASAEPLLSSYLFASVLSHPSLERSLAFVLSSRLADATLLGTELFGLFLATMRRDPSIANAARADLIAVRERDPACRQFSTALLHFKGFQALQTHRIAHALWMGGRKALALVLQSRGNEVFAVDMHPAARVGRGVLLDHGTGIVVGATAVIGDDVSLLQNVTLGGTGKEQGDRHPKIGRGVLIGASATVLGNIEVGEGAQVASGSMVLKPVPPHALVAGSPARVVGRARGVPARLMNHWCPCGKEIVECAPGGGGDETNDGANGAGAPGAGALPAPRPPVPPPTGGAASIAAASAADSLAGIPHHIVAPDSADQPVAPVPRDDAGLADPFFTGFRSAAPHPSEALASHLRPRRAGGMGRAGALQSSEGALSAALGAAAARADEAARRSPSPPAAFVSSAVATAKAPLETHSSIGREAAHSPALSFDAWDYQI